MSKDDKINLKLEVYKDKNSGKLALKAHFDDTAPNIYKDKDTFYWAPTLEEKEFLYEAFKIMPEGPTTSSTKDTNLKSEESTEKNDTTKPEKSQEIEELIKEKTPFKDETPTEQPTEENLDKSSTLSSKKDTQTDDTTSADKGDNPPVIDDVMLEEIDDDEAKNLGKEQDKAMIVEADADAIDEAIKKHTKNDDDTIVEADEQTIIDKVLSQKKKGRWGKK
ncbi:hypothetical protein AYK21_01695 [Thermoplasmatales archaeon SG8-52-2]|nr:MAG: hypothetical protein AYK21_01695 [Thermoplasmatales archaeon SG8-52-2]